MRNKNTKTTHNSQRSLLKYYIKKKQTNPQPALFNTANTTDNMKLVTDLGYADIHRPLDVLPYTLGLRQ